MKFKLSRIIINAFSYLIVFVSFYYIIHTLKNYDLSVFFVNSALITILYITIFGLIKSIFLFVNSYIFKIILEFNNGAKLPLFTVLNIYVKSNITKYIPSNIMPYVSRIYLGNKVGLGKINISLSGFLEIFLGLSNTAIIILGLLLTGLAQFPKDVNFQINYSKISLIFSFLIFVTLLMFLAYLVYLYKNRRLSKSEVDKDFYRVLNKYFNFKFFSLYLRIFFLSFISFLLSSIVFYIMVFVILNLQLNLSDFFNIAICLGIAGYSAILTPGVPGGIGVKESISVLLISLYGYERTPIVLAVILSRIVWVFSDILSYMFVYIFEKSNMADHSFRL